MQTTVTVANPDASRTPLLNFASGSADHVFQLPYVSGPVIPLHQAHHLAGKRLDSGDNGV
jgi:hypothetical protein